jgi:hypothetical protein
LTPQTRRLSLVWVKIGSTSDSPPLQTLEMAEDNNIGARKFCCFLGNMRTLETVEKYSGV